MIKTPEVSTDYYVCNGVMVLQSHCQNKCGFMYPPIEKYDNIFSNTKKYKLNNTVCTVFKLGYKEGSLIVDDNKNIQDPYEYIEKYSMDLSNKTGKKFIEIFCFCMKQISNYL